MTKLATFLLASLIAVPSFAFVPKTQEPLNISTDSIYMKDKADQMWQTKTDCQFNISAKSTVKVKSIERRKTLRVNHRLLVSVDGDRQVCRVTKLSTV